MKQHVILGHVRITLVSFALFLASVVPTMAFQESATRSDSAGCPCSSDVSVDWFDCGARFPGYEGEVNGHGTISCAEGQLVCLADDLYTSSKAVGAALDDIVTGRRKFGTDAAPQRALRVTQIGSAYVVELSGPVRVRWDQEMESKWLVVWVAGSTLWQAYACDRDIALGCYQKQIGQGLQPMGR